jgi:hypothetical protein
MIFANSVEPVRLDARAGRNLCIDQAKQLGGHGQAADLNLALIVQTFD